VIVLLFGPPGCGKGTQSAFIAESLRVPAISTGEMFRAESASGSELGKLVSSIMASGGLVSDDVVNQVVASRLSKPDCQRGFLLDGYPRTVAQAQFLTGLLNQRGLPAPVVIHIDVPDEVLVARLTARRQCPQCGRIYNLLHQPPKTEGKCDADGATLVRRKDDCETVIRERLAAYQKLSSPLIDYYRNGEYHRIDGNRNPADIAKEIEAALGVLAR
jgi:adenylate kinase